jgi:PKD repeat protein
MLGYFSLNFFMTPKKLIFALWTTVVLVALVVMLTPSNDGYREFAATQIAPAKLVAAAAPADLPIATAKKEANPAASASPVAAPAISLSGVSALLADASLAKPPAAAPSAPTLVPAPVNASKDARLAGASRQWRRASTVSKAEIEAAVVRDEMTPQTAVAFRSACGHDHDLHFDSKGRPLYSCSMKIQVGPDTTPITSTPSYPLADTFKLHSRPTATRKIYLDFDGHITPAGIWNDDTDPALVNPPWSIDGAPAFSDAEKAVVQEAFRRVAEHFAPWNVDVTTEDPGVESLRKTSPGDLSYGIRVVIGAVTGEAGGVAHLNSFSSSVDDPCFVYTEAGYGANVIAGIASHEVGHTVSLLHQGDLNGTNPIAQEYFGGHGSGALSWSPIMGNGLRPVNQWAKGEYQGANRTQDNLVAIANASSGIPLVADDHGGTMAAATVAPGLSVTGGGVISSASDLDLFKFTAGRGNIVITPKVSLFAPNLRLQIRVLSSTGAILGTFTGAGTAGNMAPAPITFFAPAGGVYYLELKGIGNGDGITSGYTDYGSIGIYSFVASWQDFIQKPVAAITSDRTGGVFPVTVAFDGGTSSDPDGVVVGYSWNFGDPASASANTSTLRNPSHTYAAPGTYTASLVVTDNQGNVSAAATQVITVSGTALANSVHVGSVTGSWVRMTNVEVAATATIRAVNQYGQPLRSIAVYVTVTGSASGKAAAKTDANGYVTIQMRKQRMTNPSTYTFTVTSLVYPTYPYNAAANLPSPASVTITR